jgi:hypothetical protein
MKDKKIDLAEIIKSKINAIPQMGFTPDQLAQVVKEGQNSTLTERSIDNFLKIFQSDEISTIDRMTVLNDEQNEDLYDANLINDLFYKYFATFDKDIYSEFIKGVERRFISVNGRGLEVYENISAGRSAQDIGLFRGIFNSLSRKLFDKDDKKL